jgi:predicted  nucleic acid-binding Zn-ribbon protein
MSKLGTLKSLPTPSELLQSVSEIKSLEQLPQLVAEQVTQAMAPLLTLSEDVNTLLAAYDQVTQVQRSSLEDMAKEMTRLATLNMETKVAVLDKSVQTLTSQVQQLKFSINEMEASSQAIQALPQELTSAAEKAVSEMQSSAQDLATQAQQVRPSMLTTLTQMLGAAMLGAMLVVAGQVGLSKLTRPDLIKAYAQASAAERAELLNRIVSSRPAK